MTQKTGERKLLEHWLAPTGAGEPIACLATSYTFDADFFETDLLSRFLGLQGAKDDGDRLTSIADMLEEEEALSQTRVCALVDRSCRPGARNLRWDVLPVTVSTGLLHAKVAVLIWRHAARILIGSANLTRAGYRQQVEAMFALDLSPGSQIPRAVVDEMVAELRSIVAAAPGADDSGPKSRARSTLDLLQARAKAYGLPEDLPRGLKLAVAPSRPGASVLNVLERVSGGVARPRRLTALSPFWDADADAVPRLMGLLAERGPVSATFVVAVDALENRFVIRAPRALASAAASDRAAVAVRRFTPPGAELDRRLHAKCLLIESDDWLAALVGSSNLTTFGLGLSPSRGHWELNLAIGCAADSLFADSLRALAAAGDELELDGVEWEPLKDDTEDVPPALPDGFVDALLLIDDGARVRLTIEAPKLPKVWSIRTPNDKILLSHRTYSGAGSPRSVEASVDSDRLPFALAVTWEDGDGTHKAGWPVNVDDPSALSSVDELRGLPADLLIAVLASNRPIRDALEEALRRANRQQAANHAADLDPLKRLHDPNLLLPRTRRVSEALWMLGKRLSRPLTSLDALEWRLRGPVGPCALAAAWVAASNDGGLLAGEAEFLLAELALTLSRVPWREAAASCPPAKVQSAAAGVIRDLAGLRGKLPAAAKAEGGLKTYVDAAFAEALR